MEKYQFRCLISVYLPTYFTNYIFKPLKDSEKTPIGTNRIKEHILNFCFDNQRTFNNFFPIPLRFQPCNGPTECSNLTNIKYFELVRKLVPSGIGR